MSLSERERRWLDEDGFLILEDFMGGELLAALRRRVAELFAEEGEQAGREFKPEPGCRRLANLVDKGEVFRRLIALPRLLACIGHVLSPELKLSSLNARSVPPGAGAQPLHCDMSALADERGYWVCNSVWLLDDFTADNGTLRVVPGSHTWGRLPQQALADPAAEHPQQAHHRVRRLGGGPQCPSVARRHRQPQRWAAHRGPRLLRPPRPAAATVPEGAAAAEGAAGAVGRAALAAGPGRPGQ
jgi:ectoine hydroxylase-related dioxygenase (phytanoyl-CoA dioxygenase family)